LKLVASVPEYFLTKCFFERYLSIFFLILFGYSIPTKAANLSVSIDSTRYAATEQQNGQLFNQERGPLFGTTLSSDVNIAEQPFKFAVSNQRGTVDYFGLTQIGFPVSSRTRLNVDAIELRLPPLLTWGKSHASDGPTRASFPFSVFPLIYARRINRDIQSTPLASGLNEKLTQMGLGATLSYSVLHDEHLQLTLELSAQFPIQSRLNVRFAKFFDPAVTRPSSRPEYAIAIAAKMPLTENISAIAELKHHAYRPGPSASVPLQSGGVNAGSLNYPGSKQQTSGLSLGLSVRF
jgi:hypothetical protein